MRLLKNVDIEVLRAVAIMLVLLEHGSMFLWFEGSPYTHLVLTYVRPWTGVDLFFVVSGYVIGCSLLPIFMDRQKSRTELWAEAVAFWIRRVYRLLPSAWLWIGIAAVLSLVLPGYISAPHSIAQDALASLTQLMNFRRYFCHIGGQDCGGLFGPYWSLSLEEQFYVALPIILIFLPSRFLPAGLLAVIAAQFWLPRAANTTDWSWWFRTDGLAYGVLIARFRLSASWKSFDPTVLRGWVGPFFFAFLLLVGTSAGLLYQLPFIVAINVLAFAIMVFVASYDQAYLISGSTARRVLAWIGARSYGAYLIHILIFSVLQIGVQGTFLTSLPGRLGLWLLAIVVTFALADLNYRFFEMPLRNRGRRMADAFLSRRSAETAHLPENAD